MEPALLGSVDETILYPWAVWKLTVNVSTLMSPV